MIQPAFGNFIPIAILMYTHLSNVTSIQQMLKPRPGSEATTVNQSGYMFDEVDENRAKREKYSIALPMTGNGELFMSNTKNEW